MLGFKEELPSKLPGSPMNGYQKQLSGPVEQKNKEKTLVSTSLSLGLVPYRPSMLS